MEELQLLVLLSTMDLELMNKSEHLKSVYLVKKESNMESFLSMKRVVSLKKKV